jgi:leucyl aminopeptidase
MSLTPVSTATQKPNAQATPPQVTFRPTSWKIQLGPVQAEHDCDVLVVGVLPSGELTHEPQGQMGQDLRAKADRLLSSPEFKLWDGQTLLVKMADCTTPSSCIQAGGLLWPHICSYRKVTLAVDRLDGQSVRALLMGLRLCSWQFVDLLSPASSPSREVLHHLTCWTPHTAAVQANLHQDQSICDSVHWARWMSQMPGNIITPHTFIQQLEALAIDGLQVSYLTRQDMEKQGFGALLGVSQGSQNDPYLAVLRWQGAADADTAPWALVGKGVTFDSGGLSIKPSNGMEEMHMDKAGAVAVCATLRALALVKAKVNAVGVVALVENMPSGTAQRPGDVVTSLIGKTIKVLNTDAEGRLILADALTYTQRTYRPHSIIDLATLTGAIRVALGSAYAGLFSHNDALADRLVATGQKVGEKLWRLPLDPAYDKAIRSKEADLQNITAPGFGAGSSTAAQFLSHFVDHKESAWAHLDIAAVEHQKQSSALCGPGCTGFGVRLLIDLLCPHLAL